MGRKFVQKPRFLLHEIAVTLGHADDGIGEVEIFFRAGDGDVKKAALLLERFFEFERATGRKEAIAKHDEEDGIKFEAFGLMNGGELE